METLYGVFGMMAAIVVIALALLRAPRRAHAWEQGRTRARRLHAISEQVLEAIGPGSMLSYAERGPEGRLRLRVRSEGRGLEGAALVLDRSLVDDEIARLLEDGAGEWQGEIDGRRVEISAPRASDAPALEIYRRWLAPHLEASSTPRAEGEIVMIAVPELAHRAPHERALLRAYRRLVLERRSELAAPGP
ncbi:MAG: hypothetical protein ACK6CU_28560 [Deltaproteobacteria bacterium]|jgi:hypothetical protein